MVCSSGKSPVEKCAPDVVGSAPRCRHDKRSAGIWRSLPPFLTFSFLHFSSRSLECCSLKTPKKKKRNAADAGIVKGGWSKELGTGLLKTQKREKTHTQSFSKHTELLKLCQLAQELNQSLVCRGTPERRPSSVPPAVLLELNVSLTQRADCCSALHRSLSGLPCDLLALTCRRITTFLFSK